MADNFENYLDDEHEGPTWNLFGLKAAPAKLVAAGCIAASLGVADCSVGGFESLSAWYSPDDFDDVTRADSVSGDEMASTAAVDPIAEMIRTLQSPLGELDNGFEEPTSDCRRFTAFRLKQLHSQFGLMPDRIAITRSGTMYAEYTDPKSRAILRIEIDNDLDAVASVSRGREIVASGFLDEAEEAIVGAFEG